MNFSSLLLKLLLTLMELLYHTLTLISADYSLFINCGGEKINFEGNEYEPDMISDGRSQFSSISEEWGYSSTGVFMGKDDTPYTAQKTFSLNVTGIYETARVAPLSLRYYGLCLRKGSYKVKLHFAEIMFSNDQTFSSLGRRIFNVSIQVSWWRIFMIKI